MKKLAFYEATQDKSTNLHYFFSRDAYTPPHFHRSIEILYITEGNLIGEVENETFSADKDDIIFVRRCAIHALEPADSYSDYVLVVKAAYADDFSPVLEKETLPPLLSDKAFNRKLLPYFRRLKEAVSNENFLVSKGLIDVIIGELLGRYPKKPVVSAPNMSLIVSVLNYIDDHFREPITLESISSEFGYNKYYFSRLFNSYIGETLNSYINMVRVNNVISLGKKQENGNLCDLVFDCGFDSMTTFYRNFSRFYDKPPTEILRS